MSIAEEIRGHALEVFAVVWLFFLGASIGSFLNVVIYRVPRGMTLFGHSQCPRCGHAIRGRHNVPVLGWFLLNGRCYDCGQPIARRYPTVEAICGAMFVGLAFIELVSGGMNLPARPPNVFRGIAWIVLDPQGDLLAIYAYHCVLLSILFSWAWIAHDGGRVPAGYTLFAFALILAGPLAAPDA
ncbi:MAG: prepilin peptidase, partial [Planctomycetes bacterium]|nr:prepilin peptidase [Planctomycetota bacterium]